MEADLHTYGVLKVRISQRKLRQAANVANQLKKIGGIRPCATFAFQTADLRDCLRKLSQTSMPRLEQFLFAKDSYRLIFYIYLEEAKKETSAIICLHRSAQARM